MEAGKEEEEEKEGTIQMVIVYTELAKDMNR